MERSKEMVHQTQRKLIALDTDRAALIEIVRIARSWYEVLSTCDPRRAKSWFTEFSDIAVFVTDHASQLFEGENILEYARTRFPDVRRVVLTSYADLSQLIHGLHNGAIQKLVQKPINRNELTAAIVPYEAQAAGFTMPISKAG
jgi:DNA-binding NtrC family response regulator